MTTWGRPKKITAVNGAVVWSAKYSSFGKAYIDLSSAVENNLRLGGQYYDNETQLHYNYFRYYNPVAGRYIRFDPIGLLGGLNAYLYAYSNPIVLDDTTGLRNPLGIPFDFTLPDGSQPLSDEALGFERAVENLATIGIKTMACTALCVCGIDEPAVQKTKNAVRALAGGTNIAITGKVFSWEVPAKKWQKFAKKAGKTALKKVATGAGAFVYISYAYDIGRCSIKCISKEAIKED